MKVAVFIDDVIANRCSEACSLYKMFPPYKGNEFVIVSISTDLSRSENFVDTASVYASDIDGVFGDLLDEDVDSGSAEAALEEIGYDACDTADEYT